MYPRSSFDLGRNVACRRSTSLPKLNDLQRVTRFCKSSPSNLVGSGICISLNGTTNSSEAEVETIGVGPSSTISVGLRQTVGPESNVG